MKSLKYILSSRTFHLYFILALLIVLSVIYPILLVILGIYLFLIKHHIKLNIIITIIIILGFKISLTLIVVTNVEGLYVVTEVSDNTYDKTYVVTNLTYKFKFNSEDTINPFSLIRLEGSIIKDESMTSMHDFDGKSYDLSKGIKGNIRIENYQLITNGLSINNNHLLMQFIKDKNIIEHPLDFIFTLNSLNLLALLSIVSKVMFYLDVENKYKLLIKMGVIFILYIFGQSFIILYTLIKLLVDYSDLKYEFNFDKLDKLSIISLSMLLINPFFLLSYQLIIILLFQWITLISIKRDFKYHILLGALIMIPFQIIFNGNISLISLLFIPVFRKISKVTFIPLLILSVIFTFLNLFSIFENYIDIVYDFIKTYDVSFSVKKLDTLVWFIYYGAIIIIFSIKRLKFFLISLITFLLMLIAFIVTGTTYRADQVIFLDVGQGDSAIIYKNQKVIVVDAYLGVTNYLIKEGISQIDYLILTHADTDHTYEYDKLVNQFEIKKLFLSGYQDYKGIKLNTYYVSKDTLNHIKEIELTFLGPLVDNLDENSNSIVFTIHVNQTKFLFTGDIDIKAERDLVDLYDEMLKSDVIKVPHHGSNTSSHIDFLNAVKPKYAIISVGRGNRFNLPNKEVIDRYENMGVKIYFTSSEGTIIFKAEEIVNFPP